MNHIVFPQQVLGNMDEMQPTGLNWVRSKDNPLNHLIFYHTEYIGSINTVDIGDLRFYQPLRSNKPIGFLRGSLKEAALDVFDHWDGHLTPERRHLHCWMGEYNEALSAVAV
ncbi:MAG: hypothetical protein HC851_18355 [Acaryochloris sp. RU_4_1]|nr:hypothetical protein [Acaryochloris sp. RU_4_1]NJR56675.1 hypothetical protein [Acaryochloris sp. CRU_2_0]